MKLNWKQALWLTDWDMNWTVKKHFGVCDGFCRERLLIVAD